VLVDGLDLYECDFGFWRPVYDRHAYRGVSIQRTRWAYFAEAGPHVDESTYPSPLRPTDDRPPVTVLTRAGPPRGRRLGVRGVTADDGPVRAVRVTGRAARPRGANFSEWELTLDALPRGPITLTAVAEDAAGNVETTPHSVTIPAP